MSKDYNFNDLFNDKTKNALSPISYIDINNLVPNKNNPYSLSDLEELSSSIKELGLMQNLVVEKTKNNKYIIISGHRRYNALKNLVKQGNNEFKKVPCLVIEDSSFPELSTIKLHESNLTSREISPSERLNAVKVLEQAYNALKKKGYKFKSNYKGKIDFLVDKTKLSKKQVQKYSTINNSEDEEVIEEIQKGEITIDDAYDKVKKPKKVSKKDKKEEVIKLCNKLKEAVVSLENDRINELVEEILEELNYD